MVKFAGYSHDFKDKKPDEVFDSILRWLNREEAEIKTSNKASEIIAVHGSRTAVSVLHRNARKTLFFNLIATKDGTQVQVELHIVWTIYFSGIGDWRRQIHVRNCILLEELWASIQVTQVMASSNMERKGHGTCENGNRNNIGAHGIER